MTIENQVQAHKRIPFLVQIEAAKRFVSCEPLLGPIDFEKIPTTRIEGRDKENRFTLKVINHLYQVIVGGETGPGARPMHPAWAVQIRDQCVEANVHFFFKSWGGWIPTDLKHGTTKNAIIIRTDGKEYIMTPASDAVVVNRVGKQKAGHLIEGKEWREIPC